MILTLLGAALTLGAPTVIGFQIANRYRRRPAELRALQTGLSVLVTEVEYGATPLPEALQTAARAAGGVIGELLRVAVQRLTAGGGITPGEALTLAVQERSGESCLTRQDLEALTALSAVLGASGRQDQVRHLQLALDRLAGAEAAATADQLRYERMYRYVGVLTGLALVLLLI